MNAKSVSRWGGLALLATSFGCAPIGAPHLSMHPSRLASTNAGGVSVGSVYTRSSTEPDGSTEDVDSSTFVIPYGEGFARFGSGSGQLEVRVTSNAASVGYRIELSSTPSLSVALMPSFGAGYWVSSYDISGDGGSSSYNALTVSPTLAFIVMFNRGAFYLGPRIGFQYGSTTMEDSDGDDTTTSSSSFGFGTALGTILPGSGVDTSIELGAYGFLGGTDTETSGAGGEGDTSGFILVGTVGMQVGR